MSASKLPQEFIGVFYDDSTVTENFLLACETLGITYAIIRHDEDDDLQGRKVHTHFVCKYSETLVKKPTVQRFCSIAGIQNNQIRLPMRSLWHSVQYLTHESKDALAKDKYIYDRDLIVTNDPDWVDSCFLSDLSDDSSASSILNDLKLLYLHGITFSVFITRHPEFIYKSTSLKCMLELYERYQ